LTSEKKYSEALAELAYLRSDSGNEVKLLDARLLLCLHRPRESLARLGGLVNPAGREIAERDRLKADVFLKLGHEKEYLAALTRYLKAAPADWRARMERGSRFGAMGRNEEARDDFTRVLETRPKLREGHMSLARVLLALGDIKNALLSVDEVLGLRLDPKGLLLRGRVRMAGKDPAGAVKDFITARTLCREGDKELRGRISFHETMALAGLGQAREALRCAEETLRNDGERKDVSRYRFDLLLDAGPDARARLALERYGKVFGEDGFTAYARARLLAGQGKCNEALATLGTLQSIDSIEAFRIPGLRGECLYRLGKYRQALACLNQALSFASDRGQLWFLQARTYESQNQREKALASYDKALARLFESAKVHMARGLLLERMKGKEAQAIADISEAIRLRPEDASPYVWRARLRRRTGDRKGARDDLACAIKIDPANTSTRQALVDLEEESGRLEEALAGMEEIIRRNGRTPETSCRRARLLLALRRFVDCLDVSGKILAEKKAARVTRGKVQILRAEALLALRRWPEAIEESERARRQHPALAVTAAVLRGEAYLGRGKDSHGVGEPDEDYIRAYHELNGIHTRAVEGEFPPGKSARIHAAMGHYQWIAEKDHAQALAQYRRAAALAPRWSEPYRRIGAMAAGGLWPGGVDVSLTALDRARAMGHRDRAGVAFDRGRLLKQKGRYAEAVEEFRRALSVRPGWPEARKLLKVCQAMLR
jgi:tetratricopeptide (TPR) repeat protein